MSAAGRGSFLGLGDDFLEFEARRAVKFWAFSSSNSCASDGAHFGGLVELLRFEANFDVTPLFSWVLEFL
jgi:hypothetical protein